MFSKIVGTGGYLPPRRVTNLELAEELAKQGIETSDEWIVTRSGISARHFADKGVCASDLAVYAAQRALSASGVVNEAIDLIILATSTPDFLGGFPSTACIVQKKLGIKNCAAFDVQAVCSGFIYAVSIADAFIQSGKYKHVLVIGAEVYSDILDFTDRRTSVLFGDGAGAVVMSASTTPGVLSTALHANGEYADILCVPGKVREGRLEGTGFVHMDGPAVFKLAVSALEKVAYEVLNKAGYLPSDINWFIPHQANIRIMQGLAKKLDVSLEKMVVTVDQHGNTSAASIPLALDIAVRDGRIQSGHHVLMEGVGGGFTWGAALIKW